MVDFGALPPEINSARMYAGPGSSPMVAAATAWDALAAQLELFASGYSRAISALHGGSWSGASSTAMAAAAAPYIAWASATSAHAEEVADRARAAAGAFEAAFAATVPPVVIAANRTELAVLVATNFFGQNTAAIAATEAAYAEMWAQDAAAMYGYAASSTAAADVTPFSQPPQTTNAVAQSAQGGAVTQAAEASAGHAPTTLGELVSAVPQQLQQLASGGAVNASASDASTAATPILTSVANLNALSGPLTLAYELPYTTFSGGTFLNGLTQSKIQSTELPQIAEEDAGVAPAANAAAIEPQSVGQPALSVGRATNIGGLSVPQNWASTAEAGPAVQPVAASEPLARFLPPWTSHPATPTSAGMPSVGQIPSGPPRRGGNAVFRMRDRRYTMPRPASGG